MTDAVEPNHTNHKSNPLLSGARFPEFSKIKPEHVAPAIEKMIADNKAELERLLSSILNQQQQANWQSLIEPLEKMGDRLAKVWSPVSHMHSVVNSDELRDAYQTCLPQLSQYATEMGQNQQLFKSYQQLNENRAELDEIQQKIIDDALRDFKLAGVALQGQDKARYGEIKQRLSELSNQFSNNLLDATMAWKKDFKDAGGLSGLPESALSMAQSIAQENDIEGYRLTLDIPCYIAVMSYADDAQLREEMYTAYATRASEQGPYPDQFDNSSIMDEILALRHELAGLLGYDNYAELSLATKMAQSTAEVVEFLSELAEKAKPFAEADLKEVHQFALTEYGVKSLQPWDLSYYSEKLRQHKYSVSQEMLRPYFPIDTVLAGMFAIVGKLFSITIVEQKKFERWHPDVRMFDIQNKQGEYLASFYLDLYARSHKRGGAWMDSCVDRMRQSDGKLQQPVAYLVCNFSGPVGDRPALLTHDEVTTLFHEFGHGLHHMLTQVDYSDVSGINGVPWDAVELPSQFMENFCWEDQALDLISAHWETGEPLPQSLRQKMLAARNFQSAMQMVRQLEFSLFDFEIHAQYDASHPNHIQRTLDQVRQKVAVIQPPHWHRFQHSFSHIFAGGYAAGYYSYKWAEVLSADAFSLFEEQGIFNQATGLSFKQNILEKGGSKEPNELFENFRGRQPSIDALLRHSGLTG